MSGLKDGQEDVQDSTKPANNVNRSSNNLTDKSNNMGGSKDGPEDVPASTTKPVKCVLNVASNELVDKSNFINMSGMEIGTEDALVSTKSVSNKSGVVQAGEVVTGGWKVPPSSKPVKSVRFASGDDT